MIKISVQTNIDTKMLPALKNAREQAVNAVAQQVKKDTEPYVPALTKTLVNNAKIVENEIIYPGPYAKYLYNGKLMVDPETGSAWASKNAKKVVTDKNLVFNTSVHGQAQSHWFEASKAQNLNEWVKVARDAMDHFGGK